LVIVVIEPNPKQLVQISEALTPLGKVHKVRTTDELAAIVRRESQIDVFFVGVDVGPEMVRSLRQRFSVPVFLVGDLPLTSVHQAFEMGVEDIVPLPLNTRWIGERLERLSRTLENPEIAAGNFMALSFSGSPSENTFSPGPAGAGTPSPTQVYDWSLPEIPQTPVRTMNRMIVVASVKGGEGKTSFVAQLGLVLAKKGYQPLGIDADQTGNLARWIGRDVTGDITEFGGERPPTDSGVLDSLLVRHKSGFRVLPSPVRSLVPITPSMVETAIQSYRPHYPLMIVDLSEGYTPVLERLAQRYATDILVMASTDVNRMERTKQMVQLMLARGIPKQKIHVIVNKVRQEQDYLPIRAGMSEWGIDVRCLPWHSGLGAAREEGLCPVLTDPKSEYAKAFRRLVSEVVRVQVGANHEEDASPEKSKKSKKKRKKAKFAWVSWFWNRAASGED
jgi:MinD-like ATPase involved in chromosome partitioning or flagellar assembly/CheY-like chemotaxis protein